MVQLSDANGAHERASEAAAGESADDQRWARGSLQSRLVQRWTDDEHDYDLYEVLALDFGRERTDRWTGHATARLAWDIDGDSGAPFASLADSEDGEVDFQLYDAYAETRDRGAWDRLRFGRQLAYDTPVAIWFDGAWAQTEERGDGRWSTGLYGGVPVHQYESSSSGDWLAGVFEEVRPTETLRVRGDWMHVEDETDLGDHENDLLALGLFHDAGGRLRWDARYSALDGENRDLALGLTWYDLERAFTLQASFYRLLEAQQSQSLELDPFFDTLFTLFPYDETRISASKSLGEHVQLLGGLDYRRMREASDAGTYNHDFDRVFATASFDRALPQELTLALTGESWNGDDSDFQTWGADLSRRWGKLFDASLGSFYSLYKFDPLSGSEHDDVRTYYFGLRWRATDAHTFQVRYEHEKQAIDTFDSLRWGLTWRF